MSKKPTSSRLRRWMRVGVLTILAIVISAILAGLYLDRIGLPDFLKKPLLAKLEARGVGVDFTRMRLRWYRGIVIEDATLTFLKEPLRPKFSSAETVLNPHYRSLRDSKFHMDSIEIKESRFSWPVSATNTLVLSNLNTRITFDGADGARVTAFEASFLGAQIHATGFLTNASAVRGWKVARSKRPKGPAANLAQLLEKIHLSGDSILKFNFSGDAADLKTFTGVLEFSSPEAHTPWGSGTNLHFVAELRDLTVPETNLLRLKMDSAQTPWGVATNLDLAVTLLSVPVRNGVFETDLKFSARQLSTKWGSAGVVKFAGRSSQQLTNFVPSQLIGSLGIRSATSQWASVDAANLVFTLATNLAPKTANTSWGLWSNAEPFRLTWEARVTNVASPKLHLESAFLSGAWRAPELSVTRLEAALYAGGIHLTGMVNVATREAVARNVSEFDVQKISPFLTPFGQRWIAKYTWEKPPQLTGNLRVILPEWNDPAPRWREEVLPTLWLNGNVAVGRGSYRGVTASSARTDFTYSNMVWNLPHLRVDRPEGGADINLVADDRTREFQWRVKSEIHPSAIRHLLEGKALATFDDLMFATPPTIRAEIRGRWQEMEKLSLSAEIVAKDFSYRSNQIEHLNCTVSLENDHLRVTEGRLEKGSGFITAKEVALNIPKKRIRFNDVYGTVDPYLVAGLIGRKVAKHISPYRFVEPPAIRLNGALTIGETDDADMHFVVDGTQFHWNFFDADRISGRLDWVGETLLLTNIVARAYNGGRVMGWSSFDFAVTNGANYQFDLAAADVDIRSLLKGLTGKTNQLEGQLHGQMTLLSAHTSDLKTMRGHGQVNLRDGLIWDVPIFGIFSPVLNAILPGSGNSRAREASGKFTVRNGAIYSDDLEIRSPTMRLQYQGSVDFQQRVEARVAAELLRDAWLVGRVVSFALAPLSKIFEYKVTGTLSAPESEPVYIPNFLMMTLRPLHSIKKVFEPDSSKAPETEIPTAKQGRPGS